MTTLAEVIEAAEVKWLVRGGNILDNAKHAHIAAALTAWLSADAQIERMRGSIMLAMKARCESRAYCATADECSCYGDSLSEARAAVAALAEEDGR